MKTPLPLLFLLAVCGSAHAIDIVDSGATGSQVNLNGTYIQNFDTLLYSPPPLGGHAFVNNSTLPGWYGNQSGYVVNIPAAAGFGSWGDDADRALGGSAGFWALRFVNTSTQTITGFSVSFDVEQWYRGANSPQVTNTLHLYYRIYSTSINEAVEVDSMTGPGWTHIDSATFTSPNTGLTTAALLDGNLFENQGQISVTVNGITLAPGEKLWLRWITFNDNGNDHVFATDNVAVSFLTGAIPEPASAAALIGLASLACSLARRKPRAA